MSITVVIARDDIGAPTTREVYEQGAKFTVDSGDLSIISAKPQLIALYGSGNWLSVHVDDHVEVISERPAEDDELRGPGLRRRTGLRLRRRLQLGLLLRLRQ